MDEVSRCLESLAGTVVSFVFSAGEQHKNLDTVRELYETLIWNSFDRNDVLVALGGGVTGDLYRICSSHLSSRNPLCPDSHNPAFPGGFQHWRKDRRGF